jgi:hypothetical protein
VLCSSVVLIMGQAESVPFERFEPSRPRLIEKMDRKNEMVGVVRLRVGLKIQIQQFEFRICIHVIVVDLL